MMLCISVSQSRLHLHSLLTHLRLVKWLRKERGYHESLAAQVRSPEPTKGEGENQVHTVTPDLPQQAMACLCPTHTHDDNNSRVFFSFSFLKIVSLWVIIFTSCLKSIADMITQAILDLKGVELEGRGRTGCHPVAHFAIPTTLLP